MNKEVDKTWASLDYLKTLVQFDEKIGEYIKWEDVWGLPIDVIVDLFGNGDC